jgi:DNA polymerase III sliding clamp (beta) subunit (PCNA family)
LQQLKERHSVEFEEEIKMENDELLQAISETMDKKLEPIQQEITKINVTLENDIGQKLSALFDGHQLDTEKIDPISETVDAMMLMPRRILLHG